VAKLGGFAQGGSYQRVGVGLAVCGEKCLGDAVAGVAANSRMTR
jgi:hypothetical protein